MNVSYFGSSPKDLMDNLGLTGIFYAGGILLNFKADFYSQ